MGVHELWSILEPVRKSVPLYSLSGKTLAVDLSLWVCEAQHVQAMMGRVTKPHLRNLFFRVSALTLMGVKLVFVMEGEAPELKAETMSKRNQGRFGGGQKAAAAPKSTTDTKRGRFKAVLRECAEMLDYMGVPWVTAAGEAEAMCAYLDSQGLVDGCITNDGDAFLYGARTVYRNFNMNTKDPQVDCYQTCDVQRELQLSRENLVGLAIFLGCDYIPKGIQGVGKEQALRLIHTLEGLVILISQHCILMYIHFFTTSELLIYLILIGSVGSAKAHEKRGCLLCDSKRFCEPQDFDYQCPCDWHRREQSRQALSLETNIRKKTLANALFPFTEIINEFLISKDKPISHFKRRQPNMLLIQKFAYDKMEWPKHYTSEKILVLMTYTNLINKKYGKDVFIILKARVRNGVSCFEVLWTTPEHYAFPEDSAPENPDEVRTVEEESLFRLAYPEVVESFQREKAMAEENKTKKKKPKGKKEKTLPLSISTPVEPEMAMSNTVVNHERQEKAVCLGDRSDSLQSPPKSGKAASLSVSAVISALHLSDIDWESASFTSSPVNSSISVQPKSMQIPLDERKDDGDCSQETKILRSTGSTALNEQYYEEQPLWDRVIMRNKSNQINRNDNVSKPGGKKPFSSKQSCSQNTTSNDEQKPLTKTELSEQAKRVHERNQIAPQKRSKNKIKAKRSDITLKLVPKAVELKIPENTLKSRSHCLEVGKPSLLPESKCKYVSSAITDDVFIQCPASPAIDLESDDSVICCDSPLPLAERLKLKFQK
uniref:Flap endonuclease GEN homolog 1 n=1 Tax=Neogobius melanostomus TaxID=47308 RepID=A0A8C6WVZ8_9GOBI